MFSPTKPPLYPAAEVRCPTEVPALPERARIGRIVTTSGPVYSVAPRSSARCKATCASTTSTA